MHKMLTRFCHGLNLVRETASGGDDMLTGKLFFLLLTFAFCAPSVNAQNLMGLIERNQDDFKKSADDFFEQERTRSNSPSHSLSFVPCNSDDSCFEVVKRNNNFVAIRCIRGAYRGSEQCISEDGGRWASHCNVIRQHLYSMQRAGNLACR